MFIATARNRIRRILGNVLGLTQQEISLYCLSASECNIGRLVILIGKFDVDHLLLLFILVSTLF